ncbi:deoxyribonuclease IV [Candidatus Poribacteria bacterium]|nr:deoxyribonuclease IV [Candidatus Poribacteria bacterium]
MSVAGGVEKAPARAASVGCTAMQIFVKNNNRWSGPPIPPESASAYREELAAVGIQPDAVFAHACYLINLASDKPGVIERSIAALEDELRRCALIDVPCLVIHPGAHMGQGRDAGIAQIAARCRAVIGRTPDITTRILFETTAGTGTNIGATFEDLRDLLAAVDRPDRTGICLDTCHVFAAGYDIRTPEGYSDTIARFDAIVGLGHLRAIHLNDSKTPFNSRKDRHEHIGKGHIGLDAFRCLLNDPRMKAIPMSLETDKGPDLQEDRMNLDALRALLGPQARRKSARKKPI